MTPTWTDTLATFDPIGPEDLADVAERAKRYAANSCRAFHGLPREFAMLAVQLGAELEQAAARPTGIDLAGLRKLAEAATQERWRLVYFVDSTTGEPYADHEAIIADFRRTVSQSDDLTMHGVAIDEDDPARVIAHVGNGPRSAANAAYIAAASPDVVLALLDIIEAKGGAA